MIIRCLLSIFLCLVSPTIASTGSERLVKIGFIYSGPTSDSGWNYYHDQGRRYLERMMNGRVETLVAEGIPESSEAERVMEKMIAQGATIIFPTSYGYLESALRVAKKYPQVTIVQCSERANPNPVKNLSTFFASYYQTIYVVGVIAGRKTRTNNIGYIAAHPVPPIILGLDAFTLGVRSVNSKAKVHVVWTNNWYDPPIEAEAARSLIDQGADVLLSDTSSAASVVRVAAKQNVFTLAFNADYKKQAPKSWLVGTMFDWGPLYDKIVQSISDHSWRSGDYRYGIESGYYKLTSFGDSVNPAIRQEASDLLKQMRQGKIQIFKGPMKDRDGKLVIPAGKTLNEKSLAMINWIVSGVEGNVPRMKN